MINLKDFAKSIGGILLTLLMKVIDTFCLFLRIAVRLVAQILVLVDVFLIIILPLGACILAVKYSQDSISDLLLYTSKYFDVMQYAKSIDDQTIQVVVLMIIGLVVAAFLLKVIGQAQADKASNKESNRSRISSNKQNISNVLADDWMSDVEIRTGLLSGGQRDVISDSIPRLSTIVKTLFRSVRMATIVVCVWSLHLVIRSIGRAFVLLAMVTLILLIPLSIGNVSLGILRDWIGVYIGKEIQESQIIVFFVVSLVGTVFVKKFGKKSVDLLYEIGQTVIEFFSCNEWIPDFDIRGTLLQARSQIKRSLKSTYDVLRSTALLSISVVIVSILLTLMYIEWIERYREAENTLCWQQEVTKKLDDIVGQHGDEDGLAIKEAVVGYLVFHPEQGSLKTKKGICPNEWNTKWLEMVKAATAQCSKSGRRVRLEVRGFSSIAPIDVPGISEMPPGELQDRSRQYNLDVANERAEAVVEILTSKDNIAFENCASILTKDNLRRGLKEGEDFDVVYARWDSYDDMMEVRPVHDGSPEQRQRRVELFNRSVQILVTNNLCWPDNRWRVAGNSP